MSRDNDATETQKMQKFRFRMDNGTLSQISVPDNNGNPKTLGFRHERALGQERILTAEPIVLTGHDWKMFVDRGHGLHATSAVTLAIAEIGKLVAQIEKAHNLIPEKQANGEYRLSDAALKNLQKTDPNAYTKYQLVRTAQDKLREFYQLEREIDPNDIENQENFKKAILQVLAELRSTAHETSGLSTTDSDDIVFGAIKSVEAFRWPMDPDEPNGTRFRKITAEDQLAVSGDDTFVYVPKLDRASAAGSRLFPTKGLGADARDSLMHCWAAANNVTGDAYANLKSEVHKLAPSKGIGLPPLPDPLFGEGKNIGWRALRFGARALYAVADLAFGVINFTADAIVMAITRNDKTVLSTKHDLLLAEKARGLAGTCLTEIQKPTDKQQVDNLYERFLNSITSKADTRKLQSLTLYETLLRLSDENYKQLIETSKNSKLPSSATIQAILAPFHTLSELDDTRKKIADVHNAYGAAYKATLDAEFKKEPPADLTSALDSAEKAGKEAEEKALRALRPTVLAPAGSQGSDFTRSSVFSGVYHIGSTIAEVIEDMGRRDPFMGTAALATMGVGAGFVVAVAAHGGSVSSAAAANKIIADLAATKVIPAFYHGVMPVHAGAGKLDVAFAAFVDGLVMGKAMYFSLSAGRSFTTGRSGFAADLLKGAANNPIESAIAAATFYAMGHAMIVVTHAQADVGRWAALDELTASMKPAAILYDHLHPLIAILHAKQEDVGSPLSSGEYIAQHEALQKRTVDLLCEAIFAKMPDGKTDADKKTLQDAISSVVTSSSNPTSFSTQLANAVSQKIPAANNAVTQFLTSPTTEARSEAQAVSTLSQAVYDAIPNDKKQDQNLYMRVLTEAMMIKTVNAKLDDNVIATAVVNKQKKSQTAEPQPNDSDASKKQSTQPMSTGRKILEFGKTLALGVLRTAHGLTLGVLTSVLVRPIAKAMNVSHNTMRTIERWGGTDNLLGVVEGASRLGTLIGRVFVNAVRVVATAAVRLGSAISGTNAEGAIERAGIEAARGFTGKARSATVGRPDDVPWYRLSMAKVELVTPDPNKSAVTNFNKDSLSALIKTYRENLSWYQPESRLIKNLEIGFKETVDENVLTVLKTAFAHETAQLEKMMEAKKIPGDQQNAYMLASLQSLFRHELDAAHRSTKLNEYPVFEIFSKSNGVSGLFGTFDFHELDSVAKNKKTCDELRDKTLTALSETKTELRASSQTQPREGTGNSSRNNATEPLLRTKEQSDNDDATTPRPQEQNDAATLAVLETRNSNSVVFGSSQPKHDNDTPTENKRSPAP